MSGKIKSSGILSAAAENYPRDPKYAGMMYKTVGNDHMIWRDENEVNKSRLP